MEDLFSADRLLAIWNTAYGWLLTNVFVLDNAVQVAVVGADAATCDVVGEALHTLARALPRSSPAWAAVSSSRRSRAVCHLARVDLARDDGHEREQRPNGLFRTAVTLFAAWIAIHFASQFVRNRAWAKLIAWAAWSIAALSILDLLEPIDRRARLRGDSLGRRSEISLWDVVRSTIALAVLLSVALYLASLIEARIRTSQKLSPTVQVLFTKSLKTVLISLAVIVAINSVGVDLTGARRGGRLARRRASASACRRSSAI